MSRISIIIPALNEAATLGQTLKPLIPWIARRHELIVVDGGSTDATAVIATAAGAKIIHAEKGRARQMNAGAAAASEEILLFLHADTQLPAGAEQAIVGALRGGIHVWGRFDVRILGASRMFPLISRMINVRSRLSGIATGDQALFMTRTAFAAVGGFPELPLMEDVEICKRLKAQSAPACLRERVLTSGRRWDIRGVWPTIFLMWRLRYAYWRGTPAEKLAGLYH